MIEQNPTNLEKMIREILMEKLSECSLNGTKQETHGVIGVSLPRIQVSETDRMDTGGSAADKVYTKDLFTLSESPRLGCGLMQMEHTTFDWTLNYDEIDYVVEGTLSIIIEGQSVTAGPGEVIYIPKGSKIKFSVPDTARFLYVTYPADWASA